MKNKTAMNGAAKPEKNGAKKNGEPGNISGRRAYAALRIMLMIYKLPQMKYEDAKVHAINLAVLQQKAVSETLIGEMQQAGYVEVHDLPKSGKRGYRVCILTQKGLENVRAWEAANLRIVERKSGAP